MTTEDMMEGSVENGDDDNDDVENMNTKTQSKESEFVVVVNSNNNKNEKPNTANKSTNRRDYFRKEVEEKENNEKRKRNEQQKRIFLTIGMAFISTFFAGASLGWGPMQLMLETNGAFSSKCSNNGNNNDESSLSNNSQDGSTCSEQTLTLVNIQFISLIIALLSAPIAGEINDRLGTIPLILIISLMVCLALSLLILSSSSSSSSTSSSTHFDILLYPTFILLSIMAISISVIIVQTGLLFHGHHNQTKVISTLNNLFDAGTITYWCLWFISERFHLSLSFISLGYLILAVFSFASVSYLWCIVVPENNDGNGDDDGPESTNKINNFISTRFSHIIDLNSIDLDSIASHNEYGDDENDDDDDENREEEEKVEEDRIRPIRKKSRRSSSSFSSSPRKKSSSIHMSMRTIVILPNKEEEEEEERKNNSNEEEEEEQFDDQSKRRNSNNSKNNNNNNKNNSPLQQLRSRPFLFLLSFYAINSAKADITVTTAKDFLAYLGDDDIGHKYLSIFSFMMPASIFGLPLVHYILQKFGFGGGLYTISLLSLIHGIVQISSTNLNIQIIGFVAYSLFRSFLFSVVFSLFPILITSTDVMGKGTGLMNMAAALSLVINLPLTKVVMERYDGNFQWAHIIYVILCLPCFFFAWQIDLELQQRNKKKEEEKKKKKKMREAKFRM